MPDLAADIQRQLWILTIREDLEVGVGTILRCCSHSNSGLIVRAQINRIFSSPQVSFVIFASPKSGTTWVQRLISRHPEVLCGESRLFGDYFSPNPLSWPHVTLEKYVTILSQHFSPSVPGFEPANREYYRSLLFNLADTLAVTALKHSGKSRYGEKFTPYVNTAKDAIGTLREYHPQIRFVHLVRDGRDVIASGAAQWLNLRRRRASDLEREEWETALREHRVIREDFERFLLNWSDAVAAGLAARELFPHYLEIKYEEFLKEPRRQTEKLFEFIGITGGPTLAAQCVEAASFEALSGGRRPGQEDVESFFRKGVAGDWHNWLNAAQHGEFLTRAGHLLEALGYPSQ